MAIRLVGEHRGCIENSKKRGKKGLFSLEIKNLVVKMDLSFFF